MRRARMAAPRLGWTRGFTLGLTLLVHGSGCVDRADDDNDNGRSAPLEIGVTVSSEGGPAAAVSDDGTATAPSSAATDSATTPATVPPNAADAPSADDRMQGEDGTDSASAASDDSGTPTAGTPGSASESPAQPPSETTMPASIAGTAPAAGCVSYQQPQSGMCGSHFCGVTVDELAAALDKENLCGTDVQEICDSGAVTVVETCARSIGTDGANISIVLSMDEALIAAELTEDVKACVIADPNIGKNLPSACLDCFIEVAICAAAHCAVPCLADQEMCEACRKENQCDEKLFVCSGLPSPF